MMRWEETAAGKQAHVCDRSRCMDEWMRLNNATGAPASRITNVLKLQALFAQKPNLDSQAGLPHFAVIGMQSSGKTSLLSILAGMHISGPVRDSCATRCRVQYDFRASEPGTKTCEVSPGGGMPFEAVNFGDLHRRLEELQGDSFSQKVLHVRI